MIPVEPQPEPEYFSTDVRQPGAEFLAAVPKPTTKQWKGKEYWRKVLPDMRIAYNRTCAYCATWIPHSTGSHSVDHFIPRDVKPALAYEWDNFRYVSARFNSRKSTRTILDPFQIEQDWFVIDFSSFLIRPNPNLAPDVRNAVENTIDILGLNSDDDLVEERQGYVEDFFARGFPFEHLKKNVPFIAYELERQGMID